MTDHEQRQLAHILIDAAQIEAGAGKGYTVPPGTLTELPARRLTLDEARQALDIDEQLFRRELEHHLVVWSICHGPDKRRRRAS